MTNAVFFVFVTIALVGCGTSVEDLNHQVAQIKKNFPSIHPMELAVIEELTSGPELASPAYRRDASKILSAAYKKDLPEDPMTDEQFDGMTRFATLGTRTLADLEQLVAERKEFSAMTPMQKTRLKVMNTEINKHIAKLMKNLRPLPLYRVH